MTSKSPVRSCEDVDETALSYAEIKALCAGNPLIREKMDLDIDVARLRLLKADHESQRFRMEDNLFRNYPRRIKENEGFIAGLEADIETLKEHPHPVITEQNSVKSGSSVSAKKGFAGMEFHGELFTDKAEAGKMLLAEMRNAAKQRAENKNMGPLECGSYRGFSASVSVEDFGRTFILTLKGQMTHRVELGEDIAGNFLRMDNALDKIPERIVNLQTQNSDLQKQIETLRGEVEKPFAQETELLEKSARLLELNAELGIDNGTLPTAGLLKPEQNLAKMERSSVLDSLKRPLPHQPASRDSKPKKQEQER